MSYPNLPDKYRHSALFGAADVLRHRQQMDSGPTFPAPQTVIFCYHAPLLRYGAKAQRGRRVNAFFGETYLLGKTKHQIALVGGFGVGAPVTAVLLEEWAAYGVRQFVTLGVAGGLQPGQQTGDVIVVERAVRDEGSSYHYAAPEKPALPSGELTAAIQQSMTTAGIAHDMGTSWTTDAPYRETAAEIAQYQAEGVKTVEMEAAAFFIVGDYVGARVATILVVGDTLAGGRWQMTADPQRIQTTLCRVFDALIRGLCP